MAVYDVTEDELADFLRIEDEREHAHLTDVLGSAKEAVDSFCGWDFDTDTAATRVFAAKWGDLIYVDPLTAITTLSVDTSADGTFNETWSTADYQLEPLNDPTSYRIRAVESKRFPVSARAQVQIVGDFGWSTIPTSVKTAVKLHAGRLHERRNMPAGIVAGDGFATRTSMGVDADVAALLRPYSRQGLWAA